MNLLLGSIRTDGGTQPRERISPDTVDRYAEVLNEIMQQYPVDVFYDGENYWLADGFHRLAAARKLSWPDLPATIHQGTLREARAFSLSANARHGMPRTKEDRERAVRAALADEEWGKWSNAAIAKLCGVSPTYVANLREDGPAKRVFTHPKTGKPAIMNVANLTPRTRAVPKPMSGKAGKTFSSSSRKEVRLRLRGSLYDALVEMANEERMSLEDFCVTELAKVTERRKE